MLHGLMYGFYPYLLQWKVLVMELMGFWLNFLVVLSKLDCWRIGFLVLVINTEDVWVLYVYDAIDIWWCYWCLNAGERMVFFSVMEIEMVAVAAVCMN